MISHPALRNTSSKLSVNFWSRSRIKKRNGSRRSAKAHVSCRPCCVTHSALENAVPPATCTRRLLSSMKKRTYSRWSQIVSTVKKSTARRLRRCVRRNSRQVIPPRFPAGPRPALRSHVRTVVAETPIPRPFNSPPMPSQQRRRRNDEGAPVYPREELAACRQDDPIRPRDRWTMGSSLEDGEFVSQHDDFQVLGHVRPYAQSCQLQHPPKHHV